MTSIAFSGTVARLRDYGCDYDGTRLVEVSWSFVSGGSVGGVRGSGRDPEKNRERAVRRAKAELRRKVMAGGLDHLLTLTTRRNLSDEEEADRLFARFVREVHKRIRGWHYVAVKERQKRGAWHWHLAVRGFQNVVLLRVLWRQVAGDGNIDVQYRKKGARWKRTALAGYLSKYVSKCAEEVGFGRHRYRASQGIVIPIEVRKWANRALRTEEVLRWLMQRAGRVGYVLDQEGFGWACSW